MENLRNKLKQSKKQSSALLVMNIAIVVLCIVLVKGCISMIDELHYAFSRPSPGNYMENYVTYENYAHLVEMYYDDLPYGGRITGTKAECYGVARYFEAASMYRAYLAAGDSERAAREKAKMDAAYEEMGDWNIAADSIQKKLGLVE